MAQFARPDADTSKGNWSASSGSNLYAMIDESSASDSDYMTVTDSGGSAEACTIRLSDVDDPGGHSGHSVVVRAYTDSFYSSVTLNVNLRDGSTSIKNEDFSPSTSFGNHTMSLSTTQAGNISDYTDLNVIITATDGFGMSSETRVSHLYFTCPEPAIVPAFAGAATSASVLVVSIALPAVAAAASSAYATIAELPLPASAATSASATTVSVALPAHASAASSGQFGSVVIGVPDLTVSPAHAASASSASIGGIGIGPVHAAAAATAVANIISFTPGIASSASSAIDPFIPIVPEVASAATSAYISSRIYRIGTIVQEIDTSNIIWTRGDGPLSAWKNEPYTSTANQIWIRKIYFSTGWEYYSTHYRIFLQTTAGIPASPVTSAKISYKTVESGESSGFSSQKIYWYVRFYDDDSTTYAPSFSSLTDEEIHEAGYINNSASRASATINDFDVWPGDNNETTHLNDAPSSTGTMHGLLNRVIDESDWTSTDQYIHLTQYASATKSSPTPGDLVESKNLDLSGSTNVMFECTIWEWAEDVTPAPAIETADAIQNVIAITPPVASATSSATLLPLSLDIYTSLFGVASAEASAIKRILIYKPTFARIHAPLTSEIIPRILAGPIVSFESILRGMNNSVIYQRDDGVIRFVPGYEFQASATPESTTITSMENRMHNYTGMMLYQSGAGAIKYKTSYTRAAPTQPTSTTINSVEVLFTIAGSELFLYQDGTGRIKYKLNS